MSIPPRDVFAAETRKAVDAHDEWDSPHAFTTLHWDGVKVTPRTYVCIMPDIHPKDYPRLMMKAAREEFEKDPDDPAYAYLLQIEAFGCPEPGPDASAEERSQFETARRTRTFHKRPDARELCTAWCVDIHGRAWSATKPRGGGGSRKCSTGRGKPPVASSSGDCSLSRALPGRSVTGLSCLLAFKAGTDEG